MNVQTVPFSNLREDLTQQSSMEHPWNIQIRRHPSGGTITHQSSMEQAVAVSLTVSDRNAYLLQPARTEKHAVKFESIKELY